MCLVDFLDGLVQCSRHAADVTLRQCQNLCPAGTGTRTLYKYLLNKEGLAHHDHVMYMESSKKKTPKSHKMPPKCFISTLRKPAGRMESGRRGKVECGINNMVETMMNERDRGYKKLKSMGMYGIPQAAYFEPSMCEKGATEVHILCTERLNHELANLGKTFGEPLSSPPRRELLNCASLRKGGSNYQRHMTADLAHYVNYEVSPEDSVLHAFFCAG